MPTTREKLMHAASPELHMRQENHQPHHRERRLLRAALADCEFVLKNWDIVASPAGDILVRPHCDATCVTALAGLLTLLRKASDPFFPRTVVVNFNGRTLVGEEWTTAISLVGDFAASLNGKLTVIAGRGGHPILLCDRRRIISNDATGHLPN